VAAHGIMIIAPVNWYHAPGALKAMMDRMVCADGGNPDPTSCACRKSNPDILVVQPAENWAAKNLPGSFDGTRERRILLQR